MRFQVNEVLSAKLSEKYCIQEKDDPSSRCYHTLHHTNFLAVGEQDVSPDQLLSEFCFEEDA